MSGFKDISPMAIQPVLKASKHTSRAKQYLAQNLLGIEGYQAYVREMMPESSTISNSDLISQERKGTPQGTMRRRNQVRSFINQSFNGMESKR